MEAKDFMCCLQEYHISSVSASKKVAKWQANYAQIAAHQSLVHN